ncbi:MAG: hypothetical protein KDE31_20290, partial [Caldilineaceae bacterium]|nr:hypothetical protein [Caldilineaceae bacterium]
MHAGIEDQLPGVFFPGPLVCRLIEPNRNAVNGADEDGCGISKLRESGQANDGAHPIVETGFLGNSRRDGR